MWSNLSKDKITWKLRDYRQFLFENMLGSVAIFLGIFILILNLLPTGHNDILFLGLFMYGLFFLYKQMWFFSLAASLLTTMGIYYTLLLNNQFTQGGESSFLLFFGVGFLIHYLVLRKWSCFWPLIPAVVMLFLGALTMLNSELSRRVLSTYWPLLLVLVGGILLGLPKIHEKISNYNVMRVIKKIKNYRFRQKS
ncbi:hypothetical protein PRVXT_002820 [Proteinivorax tanatarense]|uniref:Uncharacterized protein n=1 Tax=Proteinivorax tanatarense TaxID=1260629 RepID=A0AAU7VLE8_9FIRM